jgi:hypothetical protein
MQSLILNAEDTNSSYALARSVSVLDAVNWVRLAVKKTKAGTVKKKTVLLKLGFEEACENIAAMSILCRGKELSCSCSFVRSDDHLATHYSFESATALLVVRNTQN